MGKINPWGIFIPRRWISGTSRISKNPTLRELATLLSEELRVKGKVRTGRAYLSVLKSVNRYNGEKEVEMKNLSQQFLLDYETYLKARGNSLNTISFYMRNLRAMYNKGVQRNFFPASPTPLFSGVYTGIDHTPKRAAGVKEVVAVTRKAKEIRENQNHLHRSLLSSFYYFLFCFYARGMCFIDLAYLKKSNIVDGNICYQRHKTGARIILGLTPELKEIIDFFSEEVKDSEFLFPVIDSSAKDMYQQRTAYESGLRRQNKHLKVVARLCGITSLSTHVARHSWATQAKQQHIPLEMISESLGHTSVKTTSIYLDLFETKELDKANRKVAEAIRKAI